MREGVNMQERYTGMEACLKFALCKDPEADLLLVICPKDVYQVFLLCHGSLGHVGEDCCGLQHFV